MWTTIGNEVATLRPIFESIRLAIRRSAKSTVKESIQNTVTIFKVVMSGGAVSSQHKMAHGAAGVGLSVSHLFFKIFYRHKSTHHSSLLSASGLAWQGVKMMVRSNMRK